MILPSTYSFLSATTFRVGKGDFESFSTRPEMTAPGNNFETRFVRSRPDSTVTRIDQYCSACLCVFSSVRPSPRDNKAELPPTGTKYPSRLTRSVYWPGETI